MADGSSVKVDLTDLVSRLTKFMAWNAEQQDIIEHRGTNDSADRLMDVLGVPREKVSVLIGGSDAPIFRMAADTIERLQTANPDYPLTRADFAALILKGIVCGMKWEMLPDGTRGWRWDGYLRDSEVKELCDFAREDYPKELHP